MTAEPRIIRTEAEQAIAEAYGTARETLPGSAAVKARRDEAMAIFQRAGLPHRRVETWKYTDLRARMRKAEPLAPAPTPAEALRGLAAAPALAGVERYRLVIADGHFQDELSDRDALLAEGIEVAPLRELLAFEQEQLLAFLDPPVEAAGDVAVALNLAFAADGVGIMIAEGCRPSKPIEIVHLSTGAAPVSWYARSFVSIGKAADVRLLSTATGPDGVPTQANSVLALLLGAGAKAKLAGVGIDGDGAQHIATLVATVAAGASLDHLALTAGGALTRLQAFYAMADGARLNAHGATMLAGKSHADAALVIDHAEPNATSRITYRSVADGAATGAFQGRIIVRPGAQKTDARMSAKTLLLSDEAEFAAKPELEIYADDVQCGHGATSGQIDEEMLFYLLSRGIPRAEAETLLLTAFLSEAIEGFGDPEIAAALEPLVVAWLQRRGAGRAR